MPANLMGAWTEVACYEMPLGAVPDDVLDARFLTADEVALLADFLEEYVVGESRITRENCAAFNDGNMNAPACLAF
jgi:hypothetical protein